MIDLNSLSQNIIDLIKEGKVQEAGEGLGYCFFISGNVVRGKKFGRALRYPTANIEPVKTDLIPAHGVYAAMVKVKNNWYNAMVNVGVRPTLSLDNVVIEAHLLGFDGDLYNEVISIHFVSRIRKEVKFSCTEDLKRQLDKDKNIISKLLVSFSLKYSPDDNKVYFST